MSKRLSRGRGIIRDLGRLKNENSNDRWETMNRAFVLKALGKLVKIEISE